MTAFEKIDLIVQENTGIISTTQVIKTGISKTVFYKYVKEKSLRQVSHGIYVSENAWTDDILFYKNNASGLKNYLATQEGMTDSLKQLVGAVIDGLNDIHKQTDGTDKILGMLYKIYTIGNTYFETGSVKDTVLDNWIIIVRMFTKADETYIRDFILKIYPNLCDYVKDATGVDIGAIMPPQTITFWMKVRAFFQKILEFFQRIFGIKRIMA